MAPRRDVYRGLVATPQQPPGGSGLAPFSRVVRVDRTGSTNADLADALRAPSAAVRWPHLSVLVAEHQAAGRGRTGRVWETPRGSSLTASVVVRTDVAPQRWSWLGLLGGLAVARAVNQRTGLSTAVKWPNDVVVVSAGAQQEPGWGRDRKVAGLLAELVRVEDAPPVAVLGFGVNLHQLETELPVPWATSLAAAGASDDARDPDLLLGAVGRELAEVVGRWQAASGNAVSAGLADELARTCATLGQDIRVTLPGGAEVSGRATALAADGGLLVRPAAGAAVHVTAGDVRHIRVAVTG